MARVGATAQISEAYLVPIGEAMLAQFPFQIRGFHSDNGSAFINHTVEKLLNKLLIEQTKSRPRHSNDNGLVECKNGAVVRKHMGYTHIAAGHAAAIQDFYEGHFNPYLNFHRPCGVPERTVDAKGKEKRVYPWYATPWEVLRPLPGVAGCLKEGITIEELERKASAQSDTTAAEEMQKPRPSCSPHFIGGSQEDPAVEMAGYGHGGKPEAGFPPCPQPLEIAEGDFHIPTAPTMRPDGKVEIQKQDFPFPTGSICLFKAKERRPGSRSLRFRLQAHSWMRKCCSYRLAAKVKPSPSGARLSQIRSSEWSF